MKLTEAFSSCLYLKANLQSKTRGERVPVESKAYPGEFFFFVRVNELLHGLGSRLQVQLNYLDIIKPFAECALLQYNLINSTTESIPIEPLPIVDSELNYKVSSVLKQLEATNRIAGAQVCVLDANGNALVDLAAGHMGGFLRQHPMRRDTLILGFSCTKAVTATLAHIMVAEGYLTPDEPVCDRVWPSFCPYENPPPALFAAMHDTLSKDEVLKRWAWKRNITLRHILTHSAGLWSTLPPRLTIQRLSSCESCVAAFEYDALNPADTILPSRAPGEKGEYHFLSFGWLVAGVLCGAYRERHMKECTFDDVYQAVLLPKLSAATQNSGFRPNGCDSSDPLALVEIDAAKTRFILQVEREAESMGEDTSVTLSSEERIKRFEPLLPSLKGREFLIDPRIWNCKTGRTAVCPAAGGRFSARGLAHFYRDLGQKGILLSKERVEWASSSHVVLENVMQGQTTMVNNSTRQERTVFGLGYQIVSLNEDEEVTPTAFGHAGVGGSIGFYHKPSGVSVAVMLNKADVDTETAKKIVTVIAEHLGW
jgi:aarF domain-containing kinase